MRKKIVNSILLCFSFFAIQCTDMISDYEYEDTSSENNNFTEILFEEPEFVFYEENRCINTCLYALKNNKILHIYDVSENSEYISTAVIYDGQGNEIVAPFALCGTEGRVSSDPVVVLNSGNWVFAYQDENYRLKFVIGDENGNISEPILALTGNSNLDPRLPKLVALDNGGFALISYNYGYYNHTNRGQIQYFTVNGEPVDTKQIPLVGYQRFKNIFTPCILDNGNIPIMFYDYMTGYFRICIFDQNGNSIPGFSNAALEYYIGHDYFKRGKIYNFKNGNNIYIDMRQLGSAHQQGVNWGIIDNDGTILKKDMSIEFMGETYINDEKYMSTNELKDTDQLLITWTNGEYDTATGMMDVACYGSLLDNEGDILKNRVILYSYSFEYGSADAEFTGLGDHRVIVLNNGVIAFIGNARQYYADGTSKSFRFGYFLNRSVLAE